MHGKSSELIFQAIFHLRGTKFPSERVSVLDSEGILRLGFSRSTSLMLPKFSPSKELAKWGIDLENNSLGKESYGESNFCELESISSF